MKYTISSLHALLVGLTLLDYSLWSSAGLCRVDCPALDVMCASSLMGTKSDCSVISPLWGDNHTPAFPPTTTRPYHIKLSNPSPPDDFLPPTSIMLSFASPRTHTTVPKWILPMLASSATYAPAVPFLRPLNDNRQPAMLSRAMTQATSIMHQARRNG